MQHQQVFSIDLTSPENATCEQHTVRYVAWTDNLVQCAKQFFTIHHNVVWQRDYSSGGHSCLQYHDFASIFRDERLRRVDQGACPIKDSFLQRDTKTVNERFRQAVIEHKQSCCCDCTCGMENDVECPEECTTRNCVNDLQLYDRLLAQLE